MYIYIYMYGFDTYIYIYICICMYMFYVYMYKCILPNLNPEPHPIHLTHTRPYTVRTLDPSCKTWTMNPGGKRHHGAKRRPPTFSSLG